MCRRVLGPVCPKGDENVDGTGVDAACTGCDDSAVDPSIAAVRAASVFCVVCVIFVDDWTGAEGRP